MGRATCTRASPAFPTNATVLSWRGQTQGLCLSSADPDTGVLLQKWVKLYLEAWYRDTWHSWCSPGSWKGWIWVRDLFFKAAFGFLKEKMGVFHPVPSLETTSAVGWGSSIYQKVAAGKRDRAWTPLAMVVAISMVLQPLPTGWCGLKLPVVLPSQLHSLWETDLKPFRPEQAGGLEPTSVQSCCCSLARAKQGHCQIFPSSFSLAFPMQMLGRTKWIWGGTRKPLHIAKTS